MGCRFTIYSLFIDIHFELWIYIIRISDITTAHLLVLLNRIMNIHNSVRFMNITYWNYGYHLFELWISVIRIMGANKWAELVISLIRIMDIHESNWDAVLLFIPYL